MNNLYCLNCGKIREEQLVDSTETCVNCKDNEFGTLEQLLMRMIQSMVYTANTIVEFAKQVGQRIK